MTTSDTRHSAGSAGEEPTEWTGRLSAADVHGVVFTRAGFGRRGYEESEVDYFLDRVQVELRRLTSEKADLRDEVARLRRQVEAGGQQPAGAPVPDREEASLQAVRILSAAQQTADQYVADAENYSRRVTSDAREHSEQLVEEARGRVQSMLAEAERIVAEAAETERVARQAAEAAVAESSGRAALNGAADASDSTRQELEEQVTYLKAFSQVCRVQLRSYLEALLRDIEEEWGKADPAALGWRDPAASRPGSPPAPPRPPAVPVNGHVTAPQPVVAGAGPASSDTGSSDLGSDVDRSDAGGPASSAQDQAGAQRPGVDGPQVSVVEPVVAGTAEER